MGRPSKLSEDKWAEVIRLHAGGTSAAELSRRYKVHPSQITRRVSQPAKTLKTVAAQVAEAEIAFERLPVSQQGIARTLADQLKGISSGFAEVASNGVETGKILGRIAREKAQGLTKNSCMDDLRETVAFQEGANRSLAPATTLLTANKDKADSGKKTLEDYLEEARVRPA